MLQDAVIDGDRAELRELRLQDRPGLRLRPVRRPVDRLQHRLIIRQVGADFPEDRRDLPDEHPAVPEIFPAGQILTGGFQIRLFHEALHPEGIIMGRLGRGIELDIAVARIRGGRRNAQGHKGIRLLRHRHRRAHDAQIQLGLEDDMIRRENHHQGVPVFPPHRDGAPADTGGRIPGHRLAEDILLRDLRQLGSNQIPIILVRGDKDILRGHEGADPVHGGLNHRPIGMGQGQELLRGAFPALRPEALPAASRHDQGGYFHNRVLSLCF